MAYSFLGLAWHTLSLDLPGILLAEQPPVGVHSLTLLALVYYQLTVLEAVRAPWTCVADCWLQLRACSSWCRLVGLAPAWHWHPFTHPLSPLSHFPSLSRKTTRTSGDVGLLRCTESSLQSYQSNIFHTQIERASQVSRSKWTTHSCKMSADQMFRKG